MTPPIVQIIEDEPLHADLLDRALRRAEFITMLAADGESGWRETQRLLPSLILLDLMLPGLNGREVCRLVRHTPSTCHIPIIMLTALGTEADRLAGLEMGADDYVVKPFSPREVVLRVQAVLRRTRRSTPQEPLLSDDSLTVQELSYVVSLQHRQLMLSGIELAILRIMLSHAGELVTARALMVALDGAQGQIRPEELEHRMRGLRRKLENSSAGSIEILPGYRYRWHAPSRQASTHA